MIPPAFIGDLNMERKYITTKEAVERTGISKKTFERWRWIKQGPRYHKIGKIVVYAVTDLDRFMNDFAVATIDQPTKE